MRRVVVVACVLLMPTVAAAQPGLAAVEPTPTDPRYPASLADRPLVLPSGMFELSAQLRSFSAPEYEIGFLDFLYTDARARAGLGSTELFVEADFLLVDDYYDQRDRLERVGGGMLIPATRGLVALFGADLWGPTESYHAVDLYGLLLGRRKTAHDVAVQAGGGLLLRQLAPEIGDRMLFLRVEGRLGAQIQLGQSLGLDFSVRIALPLADDAGYEMNDSVETSTGCRLVSASTRLDFYAGAEIATAYGSQHVLLAGVTARLP